MNYFNRWSILFMQLQRVEGKVDRALAYTHPPTRVTIDVPRLITKEGRITMSGAVSCTKDHDLRVPLKWSDDAGTVAAPTTGTTAESSDTNVISSVDVAEDDGSIVLRTANDGTATVTVKNGSMSDTISVTVSEPTASAVQADASSATQVAKGAAA